MTILLISEESGILNVLDIAFPPAYSLYSQNQNSPRANSSIPIFISRKKRVQDLGDIPQNVGFLLRAKQSPRTTDP